MSHAPAFREAGTTRFPILATMLAAIAAVGAFLLYLVEQHWISEFALGLLALPLVAVMCWGALHLRRSVENATEREKAVQARLEREIADRQEAESGLREAQKDLERANERLKECDHFKVEFFATMSHELRTPLNSIIGFTGILRQELAGPLNEEQQKQLGMVHGSARQLLTLINNILDLSRLESGRMGVCEEVFDPAEILAEVSRSVEPLAREKHLTLETEIENPHPQIKSDRKKCVQILLNLADNAVKFTEKGGIRISARIEAREITFTVRDTGIGIPPQEIPRLFQAFGQGAGLGLRLSSRLAGLLQGSLRVESEVGAGSRFSFSLPVDLPSHS